MNANAKTGAAQSAYGTVDPEVLESVAALGRDAFEKTMRMTAEATVRACRGAAAAGTAQIEAAQALREKMGGGGSANVSGLSALSASSEAAIAGLETCMEKAIDWTRAATDAGIETAGRTMAARTLDEWVTVQIDASNRMMNLGLAQSAELARIVTDTSARCADPLKARADAAGQAS